MSEYSEWRDRFMRWQAETTLEITRQLADAQTPEELAAVQARARGFFKGAKFIISDMPMPSEEDEAPAIEITPPE